MYASVHADRTGRVLVSADREAAAMGGTSALPMVEAIPLPRDAEVVALPREAIALDRGGRPRPLGRDRSAVGALVPGHTRLLFPAYADEPSAPPLDARPYAAVAADARGDLVVAAARPAALDEAPPAAGPAALRTFPANALARQLARCGRENECRAARAGLGRGELPIPLGAPPAERPTLPLDLRSGRAASVAERAAFRPTAAEVLEVASAHLERGGSGIGFGRACDGEPLARIRVIEDTVAAMRERFRSAEVRVETCGSEPAALRRAADAGVTAVTVRIASARAETYELVHGPVAHRWGDVRASLQVAGERGLTVTIALLVLPGLTDRPAEIDALVALLGELRGGHLELRDLGADPLRVLAPFGPARPVGVRALLARLAEADHFRVAAPSAVAL